VDVDVGGAGWFRREKEKRDVRLLMEEFLSGLALAVVIALMRRSS
jgi:hypothetical protein